MVSLHLKVNFSEKGIHILQINKHHAAKGYDPDHRVHGKARTTTHHPDSKYQIPHHTASSPFQKPWLPDQEEETEEDNLFRS